jgi:hypothetical protein
MTVTNDHRFVRQKKPVGFLLISIKIHLIFLVLNATDCFFFLGYNSFQRYMRRRGFSALFSS